MPSLKDLLYPEFVTLPAPLMPVDAKEKGFVALTYPYLLPLEELMLQRAIAQLETVPWILVHAGGGKVELWRKKNGSEGVAV